jgi:hypothetical protein
MFVLHICVYNCANIQSLRYIPKTTKVESLQSHPFGRGVHSQVWNIQEVGIIKEVAVAKPIARTPVLQGKEAQTIIREIEHGTPMTPARRELLSASEQNFERHRHVFVREGAKSER